MKIEYALNSARLEEEAARAGGQLVHKLGIGVPEQVGEIVGDVFNKNQSGKSAA